jgi:hypothetical protein
VPIEANRRARASAPEERSSLAEWNRVGWCAAREVRSVRRRSWNQIVDFNVYMIRAILNGRGDEEGDP